MPSARVLLESLGRRFAVNELLAAGGQYDPDSDQIEPYIRALIANRIEPGGHHLRVVTAT